MSDDTAGHAQATFFDIHYNNAPWYIRTALRDLVAAIKIYPLVAIYSGTRLSIWFADHRPELLEDRYPHTVEQFRATDALMQPLKVVEERIGYSALSAVFLSIVALESHINVCCYRLFGEPFIASIESLSLTKKLATIYALRGEPFAGTLVNEAIGELVEWRNRFAHGKVMGRPKGLRQRLPVRHPAAIPSEEEQIREAVHLIRHSLHIERALNTFAPPDGPLTEYTKELDAKDEEEMRSVLEYLDSLRYDEYGRPEWPVDSVSPQSLEEMERPGEWRTTLIAAGADLPPLTESET